MRHRLYVHVTWTTRDRAPLITAKVAMFLARFLPAIAAQERAGVLAVGVVSNHVHLLLRLDPATVIARLMQRLKGGSAALAQRERHSPDGEPLRWAKGYNLESVSPGSVPTVVHHLLRQPQRDPHEAIAGWPPPGSAS